jgi:hypothetical protein
VVPPKCELELPPIISASDTLAVLDVKRLSASRSCTVGLGVITGGAASVAATFVGCTTKASCVGCPITVNTAGLVLSIVGVAVELTRTKDFRDGAFGTVQE